MRDSAMRVAEMKCLSKTQPVIGPSERRATASRWVRIFFHLSRALLSVGGGLQSSQGATSTVPTQQKIGQWLTVFSVYI